MSRPAAIVLLLALAACPSKVKPVEGELRFSTKEVDFGTVFVGHPVERTVELVDTTNAPADGLLSTGNPELVVSPAKPHSNGGETITAHLSWNPGDAGTLSAHLSLESGGSPDLIAIAGTAVLAPACPALPCHSSSFDADAGLCVFALLPDGTACPEDLCLAGGTCTAGVCRGAPASCDDGDPCTLDGCGDQGCVHLDVSGACPMPSDPCQAAACDRDAGCIGVPLADGQPCGPNDCTTAKVCVSGACVDRPAPNGSICAPASLCADAGVCAQGVCVQPPPVILTPDWSYPPENQLRFVSSLLPPLLDDDDNVYFTELSGQRCWFASLDRLGRVRWRINSGDPSDCVIWAIDQAAGQLYTATSTAAYQARSLSNGQLRWVLDPAVQALGGLSNPVLSGRKSTGVMYLRRYGATVEMNGVDRQTGQGVTSLDVGNSINPIAVGDGNGEVLVTVVDGGGFALATLDNAGLLQRIDPVGQYGGVQAASGGIALLDDALGDGGVLWSLVTHAPRASIALPVVHPVTDDRTAWITAGSESQPGIAGFDLMTGAQRLTLPFTSGPVRAMYATDRATVLVFGNGSPSQAQEIDTSGAVRMSCPVAEALQGVLGHERLFAISGLRLVSTPLPGVRPAVSGWVEQRGNAHGDWQPR